MTTRMNVLVLSLACILTMGGCKAVLTERGKSDKADLRLAASNQTDYVIVKPDVPTAVDEYAIRELTLYLKQITGADFTVVKPDEMTAGKTSIFVGLSAPALKRLGKDPLAKLQEQEHVARSVGPDICLYGKGIHGNLYAVMEFLENYLGWRWYSVFELPVLPAQSTVTLKPFNRKKGFSFTYRSMNLRHSLDYAYQQKVNMGFDSRSRVLEMRDGASNLSCFVSALPDANAGVHNLFSYIPPAPGVGRQYDWVGRSNYFETNPDFFSQWDNGRRVNNKQLCFSNPGLRQELTKNVLKHVTIAGDRCLLAISAQDNPGPFCYCPACKALEEQYKSPGGPIYDYLIELCTLLKTRHPLVLVKTLAYRLCQTQKPPALPEGQKLPENLVIDFAPIEDNYFADWTHPDEKIQETYRDLQAWGKITTHLWAWLYPNPYGSGFGMPVGNLERNINQIRLMHKTGVRGLFFDHIGFRSRNGLSELQSYLFSRLMQDVNCDTDAVIKEFTDNFYGPAAPVMRTYLAELEQGRKAMTNLPPGVRYRSGNTDEKTFPYLTVENIHRWQTYFDRMEERVTGQPERVLLNVRVTRRELDIATLWKWFDLQKAYPDYFKDHTVFSGRINAVNEAKAPPPPAWEKKSINRQATKGPGPGDFVTLIEAGGKEKPLPPEFDGIDKSLIKTFVPKYSNRRPGRAIVKDPEAAFGYAVPVGMPDLPFTFGFYQKDTKTHGVKRTLELKDISPGEYKLYKLGMITVTPNCIIWFSRSWSTGLDLGERLYEPGAGNAWEAYVSLNFAGGGVYGGKANEALMPLAERKHYGDNSAGKTETELVLVDRIILVSKSADQFKKP